MVLNGGNPALKSTGKTPLVQASKAGLALLCGEALRELCDGEERV